MARWRLRIDHLREADVRVETRALVPQVALARIYGRGATFLDFLEANASRAADPDKASRRSRDPGDDYLLALAASCRAVVVSGDGDLLALRGDLPIYSAAEFLATLEAI